MFVLVEIYILTAACVAYVLPVNIPHTQDRNGVVLERQEL